MSPTIPPVLVLSLLLVSPPPPAEAGEMMDLFALIRGTLKYWRRIYQMYEEEVALGYCWAEYFLHHEEDSKNAPMSPAGSIDPLAEFVPVEEDAFANGVVTQWKDWVMSVNHGAAYRRSKRSYGASNSTRERGISEMIRKALSAFAKIADEETSRGDSPKSFRVGRLLEDEKDLIRSGKNDRETSNCVERDETLKFLGRNTSVLGSRWKESNFPSNFGHRKRDKNMENLILLENSESKTKRHSYETSNYAKEKETLNFFGKNSRVYSKIEVELGSSSNESKSNFAPDEFANAKDYGARGYNLAKFPLETSNSTEAREISDKIVATSASKSDDESITPNVDTDPVAIRIGSKERISNLESIVDNFDSPRREFPRNARGIGRNSVKEVIEEISKASEESSKTGEWTAWVKKSTTSDMYAEADEVKLEPNKKTPEPEVDEEGDPVKYERFARNLPRRGRRSSGIPNSANADTEEISKIPGNLSARELSTRVGAWRTSETPRSKLTDPRRDDAFSKGLRKRRAVPSVGDSAKAETRKARTDWKSNPGKSNERRRSARKAASDMLSKATKVKLSRNEREIGVGSDSRSIDRLDPIDIRFPILDVDVSSFPVPSSSSEKQRASGRLFSEKEKKMTRIDAKFKRSRAEGDLGSWKPRVDTRRKLLYPTTSRVTSGTPTRVQPDKRQGPRRFPLGNILSLNSRSQNNWTSGELEDNRLDDLRGKRNLVRSTEQRSRSGSSYRRNSRRKRDANDRVRILVRSLSKPRRASTYDPSLDEIQRSSGKPESSGYEVWINGMKRRSTNPKSVEDQSDGNPSSLLTKRIENPSKTEMYYLKSYRDTSSIDPKVAVRSSPVALGGIASVPFRSKEVSLETFGASDHVPSRNPSSEEESRKRAKNRGEGSSWKQLRNARDNRYRRTVPGYLLEKSIGKRTGKKSGIRHPVGRPSLLAVSQQRFMGDYGSRSSRTKDQGRRSSTTKVLARGTGRAYGVLFYLRQAFMGFLRTLGFFVNVGRQLMDYVDSNSVLACTKDYLVGKAIHWIDS